jgi:RsiW-degrading membrane proteinase PrsW (M82 family)
MIPALLVGSATLPALLMLWYLYARDENPEPRGVVLRCFLLGMAICVPVIPVALLLSKLGDGSPVPEAFLGAAIPEESFKFLVLWFWARKQPAFDEPMDGIIYGATASLGFAALENILYVGSHGFATAALRAATAMPAHCLTGVIMGAYAGRAVFGPPEKRAGTAALGFFFAVLLHGAYDAVLMTREAWAFLALPLLAFELLWSRKLIAGMQVAQFGEPIARLPSRTAGALARLVLGGAGASLGGVLLLVDGALVFDGDVSGVTLAVLASVIALPTWLAVRLFRSGLAGPFAA